MCLFFSSFVFYAAHIVCLPFCLYCLLPPLLLPALPLPMEARNFANSSSSISSAALACMVCVHIHLECLYERIVGPFVFLPFNLPTYLLLFAAALFALTVPCACVFFFQLLQKGVHLSLAVFAHVCQGVWPTLRLNGLQQRLRFLCFL